MSIFKSIDKVEVVSFDVFDTLIKRNCASPHDIFDIVERELNLKGYNVSGFRANRINAEVSARQKSEHEEINLDEIYNELTDVYGNLIDILKKTEIETELKFCVRNQKLYDIYSYCKEKNKKIIGVSDMYLPSEIIRQILQNAGYETDKLYVSSEYRKLKRSNNLFRHVLKDLSVKAKKVLHIGDSKRSDFLNPKLLGMKSYLVKKHCNNLKYLDYSCVKNLNDGVIFSFLNNNIDIGKNDYYKIGYELLGPLVYGFCLWLKNDVCKKGIEKLFFCARDMLFVQKAYNSIFGTQSESNSYLYISRISTKLPYLHINNGFSDFLELITDKKMTIAEIISSMGIQNFPQEIIGAYGFGQEEYNNASLKNNKKFIALYNEKIVEFIIRQSAIQYDYFKSYLDDIGFKGKVALIDLGWRGTIQYTLSKTIRDADIVGYYFGIETNAFSYLNGDNFLAYLFSPDDKTKIERELYVFRSLFEILFSATHGTTLCYDSRKNNYYVLGENENPNNGYIEDVHKGALEFIEQYKNSRLNFEFNKDRFIESFIRIGIKPTYKESAIFGDFNFSNMRSGKLAAPDKFIKYIFNWKKFKTDLFHSEWKIGFMKRLIKVKLPYYKIYSLMKGNK